MQNRVGVMYRAVDRVRVDRRQIRFVLRVFIRYVSVGVKFDQFILIAFVFNQNRVIVKIFIP